MLYIRLGSKGSSYEWYNHDNYISFENSEFWNLSTGFNSDKLIKFLGEMLLAINGPGLTGEAVQNKRRIAYCSLFKYTDMWYLVQISS